MARKRIKPYSNTLKGFFDYVRENMTPNTIVTMNDNKEYSLLYDGMVLAHYSFTLGLKIYYTKN